MFAIYKCIPNVQLQVCTLSPKDQTPIATAEVFTWQFAMLLRNASPWDWPMVVCKQIWHRIVCRIRCLDRELFHLRTLMGKEVEHVQLRAVLCIDSMLQFRTTPITTFIETMKNVKNFPPKYGMRNIGT